MIILINHDIKLSGSSACEYSRPHQARGGCFKCGGYAGGKKFLE